jgi:bisanhydrobacterioruberin hydratase
VRALPKPSFKVTAIVLTLAYAAGIIGLNLTETSILFKALTPYHLLATGMVLVWFHKQAPNNIAKVFIVSFLFGYCLEVLGVQTGLIFGNYTYGKTLGYKLFDVPLTIGINWFVLNYLFIFLVKKNKFFVPKNQLVTAIFVATGMTLLDYFIEPVAIKHNFWTWQHNSIPLQNYIGWWLGGFVLTLINLPYLNNISNNLAIIVLLLQVIFFLSQNIL